MTVPLLLLEFCILGSFDFRNTGAPSVNHRIYGEDPFQIVERAGKRVLFKGA